MSFIGFQGDLNSTITIFSIDYHSHQYHHHHNLCRRFHHHHHRRRHLTCSLIRDIMTPSVTSATIMNKRKVVYCKFTKKLSINQFYYYLYSFNNHYPPGRENRCSLRMLHSRRESLGQVYKTRLQWWGQGACRRWVGVQQATCWVSQRRNTNPSPILSMLPSQSWLSQKSWRQKKCAKCEWFNIEL